MDVKTSPVHHLKIIGPAKFLFSVFIVCFRYTYGKAVKGEAVVSVYPMATSTIIQPIFKNPLRKVVPIDGKAVVEFNVAKDLEYVDFFFFLP